MLKILSKYKKILIDFCYCMISYALPVVIIQFVIEPQIYDNVDVATNELFLTLFTCVKLLVSVFVVPLANIRLLKKQQCIEDNGFNKYFNAIFIFICLLCIIVGGVVNFIYTGININIKDVLLLSIFIILICIHDFYSIEFRVKLNYKKIIFDNMCIVLGYALGLFVFYETLRWEYIFILGYLFGSIYVFIFSKIWKYGFNFKINREVMKEYGQLMSSSALTNSSVYCDKMIINPILGDGPLSIYNAASVASKAVTVISTPLKNVLLSYIVGNNEGQIKKKAVKKLIPLAIFGTIVIFMGFYFFSVIMCKLLYSKIADQAVQYILIIVLGIIIETYAGILNVILLRFGKKVYQIIISAVKLCIYLLSVIIFSVILNFGLMGFCIAILISAITHFMIVILYMKKSISFIN